MRWSSYDAASQLLSQSDADSAYAYSYDALGRVLTVANSGTPGSPTVVWTLTYNPADDLLSRLETVNGVAGATTAFTFDNLDRVTKVQQSGTGTSAKRAEFVYDALGQFTQVKRFNDLSTTTAVVTSSFGYDQAERLTSLQHVFGASGSITYGWGYDRANRVTTRTAPDRADSYTYDADGQLLTAKRSGSTLESFTYDADGNRTNAGYATGAYDRLTNAAGYSYQYDNEGNRTRRTQDSTGAYDEYTWDHHNRLTRVVSKTSGGTVTKDVRYTYDVLDERIGKQIDATGDGSYETTERYVYAGGELALVYDGGGVLLERYLHGPRTDQVLAVERGAAGPVQWLVGDDQGTVRDVLDASGAVIDHLVVDSFGGIVSQTNAANQPRFVYTGREYDAETGLYQYRRRYYDPATGRFLSEDPSGFGAGDMNLYRYVGNRVPNATDPWGLQLYTPAQLSAAASPPLSGAASQPEQGGFWNSVGMAIASTYANSFYLFNRARGLIETAEQVIEATTPPGMSNPIASIARLSLPLAKGAAATGAGFNLFGAELFVNPDRAGEGASAYMVSAFANSTPVEALVFSEKANNYGRRLTGDPGLEMFLNGGFTSTPFATAQQSLNEWATQAYPLQAELGQQSVPFLETAASLPFEVGAIANAANGSGVALRTAPRNVLDFAETGTGSLGGKLYGETKLAQLQGYLERRGVALKVGDEFVPPGKAGGFVHTGEGSPAVILNSNPTVRQVHHELVHYLHYREIGPEAYRALPRTLEFNKPEQVVFDFFENSSKRWSALTYEEQQHMIEYIERIGGFR